MTRRYLKLAIAGCLFTLTACAQQSEIRQMHQSVSTLSQEMTQLNQQTIKITQQNALNANHPRRSSAAGGQDPGAAGEPDRHPAHVGGQYYPDGDGSRLTLRIQGESNDPLPAFTATVASGQITGTTHSYQEVNVQDQLISAPASTLAPSDVDIPLRLNVTPDKVGFIRVHDIQPAAAQ